MKIMGKDPDAKLDYGYDWTDWLGLDEIDTYELIITPELEIPELEILQDSESGGIITVWLIGGEPLKDYTVTCRIATKNNPPREDDRSIIFHIKER